MLLTIKYLKAIVRINMSINKMARLLSNTYLKPISLD